MKNLVILGGGYGGMRILHRLLPNQLPADVNITLVDKNPYHCLKTEYYALAAGTISDHHIRVTFPEHPNLHYKYGEVTSVDLDNKQILFQDGEPLLYDELVIGLGCEDKYHNVPGAEEHSCSIQTIDQSRKASQLLNNLPAGATVGIVGAGLSGVELASELRESRTDLKVKLFDRGSIILSAFPERLSRYVQSWFEENGVDIINGANVTKVEENTIYNHDEPVHCDAIVWTAGIQPSRIVRELPVEKDVQGRVVLSLHHHLPQDENVFVVGDCASLPHAPSAQLAEAQAEQIVQVLTARWKNEPLPESFPPFKLKGILGSLGKKHGFGLVGERALTGRVARLLKSGILWMYKYHNG
ncbi:NAD(P)/FAD-dependent oxidoreductase [Bacillus lacus]|uniref:NAD(P)/FAD-dependent oxidoreductase n=1 Tax=Metabacillus lacus TaxID=1983721 RepID=A0A7X2J0W4_9BACI|nr:NAD(P)/FAD-dependent oxidoreductase [Metabacillus lacus]MRX73214.1 NAD(P)/FAD-dependent oxidoreductase [Metabacillus lacus]